MQQSHALLQNRQNISTKHTHLNFDGAVGNHQACASHECEHRLSCLLHEISVNYKTTYRVALHYAALRVPHDDHLLSVEAEHQNGSLLHDLTSDNLNG